VFQQKERLTPEWNSLIILHDIFNLIEISEKQARFFRNYRERLRHIPSYTFNVIYQKSVIILVSFKKVRRLDKKHSKNDPIVQLLVWSESLLIQYRTENYQLYGNFSLSFEIYFCHLLQ